MLGQCLFDRVADKIHFPESLDACWEWTGACAQTHSGPRPVIQTAGRKSKIERVARLICAWYHGDPPRTDVKMFAGHTCPEGENSLCVNPRHLRWMTQSENERQKAAYG